MTEYTGIHLQYGCGWCAPDDWWNYDASPVLRFERLPLVGRWYTRNAESFPVNVRYGDIVKGLPLADACCDLIYCSHVLEHLALDDLRIALKETWRLLAPGGRFRLVVPDMAQEVERYRQDPSPEAVSRLMERTGLGWQQRPRDLGGLLVEWLGNSRHRWMWDYPALAAELMTAGFTDVRRASLGDSEEPAFARVEEPSRWEDALGIECRG